MLEVCPLPYPHDFAPDRVFTRPFMRDIRRIRHVGNQGSQQQRHFVLGVVGISLAVFVGMVLFIELGRRMGVYEIAVHGADAVSGVGRVNGAVFALFGLLVGFTFNGAAARYDSRRNLIGNELNSIGTAWERIDLLPSEMQDPIRAGFRGYVDTLVAARTTPAGIRESLRESAEAERARTELWSASVAACVQPAGEKARMMLLPALSELFSLVERERHARRIHPPKVIYVMLGLTALTASVFAGYGMAAASGRNWLYIVGVAAAIAIAGYVIIDLEYPRMGLIRVDEFDRDLVELRSRLN